MKLENDIKPVNKPAQHSRARFGVGVESVEVDQLIHATLARNTFLVSGQGLGVAVCDTGLNSAHVDFNGRVPVQVNFTSNNNGDINDATDGQGHGTNVGGIIVANSDHIGVAPGASIIPIKVLDNGGGAPFSVIEKGLNWVSDNHASYNISVVCMSLGGSQNFRNDDAFASNSLQRTIKELKKLRIAVVIAAGNDFFVHDSAEGMSFPAILRESVSVGAVYDNIEGAFHYNSGAIAHSTDKDRITPFSQRLHPDSHADCFTDVFAPGAPVTSSGIQGAHGESTQHGTSQATPVTCGVILLAQEFYRRATGELPKVDDLVQWMRDSAVVINDGDDENDNVTHTNKDYRRVDAFKLLGHIKRRLEMDDLLNAEILQHLS